jgi:hypothetical protein
MFKKFVLAVLIAGLAAIGGIALAQNPAPPKPPKATNPETNKCAWTNLRFAEFLSQKYGIALPDGGKNMSDADKYKAFSNALSQKGITFFSSAKPTDPVTCCDAASALYAVGGGKGASGSCSITIDYLIKNNLLKPNGNDPCAVLCNIEDVFGVVAEQFRPPIHRPDTNPPDEHHEPFSSRV